MIQDGARRHYIVPLALQNAKVLEMVYADWYVRKGSFANFIGKIVHCFDQKSGRKMLDRRRGDLDDQKIRTNLPLALKVRLAKKRFQTAEDYFQWVSYQQSDWMLKQGFGHSNTVYGFVRNVAPRLFEHCRNAGMTVISDQIIAPAKIEHEEYDLQQSRWPGWEKHVPNATQELVESVEEDTWRNSDHIICGSDYVKSGLVKCGVESAKVSVIPYAPSGADLPLIERKLRTGPVVVGFTGSICLRKGAPYFFKVARRFDPEKVKFVMVGGSPIHPDVLHREKGNVDIVGSVPRSQIASWLARFQIFFFPSTCEGCAGSVLEAMDTGLPIVSTVNSGTIVRNGVEGFIHAYDDIDGFAESIEKLVSDVNLRESMGLASRRRIEQFDNDWYANTLKTLISRQLNS